jgi:hypothetical protein
MRAGLYSTHSEDKRGSAAHDTFANPLTFIPSASAVQAAVDPHLMPQTQSQHDQQNQHASAKHEFPWLHEGRGLECGRV